MAVNFVGKPTVGRQRRRLCNLFAQGMLLACISIAAAGVEAGSAGNHEVRLQDMAGRQVMVPTSPDRILGAAPPLTALLLALDPQLPVALNMPFSKGSEGFLAPSLTALPVIGSSMGHGRQLNVETLLTLKPQLALAWLNTFAPVSPEVIEAPFRTTQIPVLYVKLDSLRDWPVAFEFVGQLSGREARGKELADYIRTALARVDAALDGLMPEQRVSAYYAETPDGLATDCHTSFHTETIELSGAYNPYRCQPKTMVGQERVNMEQITLWNPDFIIAQDPMFPAYTRKDPRWKALSAVKEKRLLSVPRLPMNWLDRPPTFTRALGILWLTSQFYPERLQLDMRAETRRFYRLFFGVELSDQQLAQLFSDQHSPQQSPLHEQHMMSADMHGGMH